MKIANLLSCLKKFLQRVSFFCFWAINGSRSFVSLLNQKKVTDKEGRTVSSFDHNQGKHEGVGTEEPCTHLLFLLSLEISAAFANLYHTYINVQYYCTSSVERLSHSLAVGTISVYAMNYGRSTCTLPSNHLITTENNLLVLTWPSIG
jgi:hypothetical protein